MRVSLAVVLAVTLAASANTPAFAASKPGMDEAVNWIATSCTGPHGTFRVHPGWRYVNGYFGNIVALGLVAARARHDLVRDWMQYYVSHAHGSSTGVDGVPDDVNILDDGSLQSRGGPDSTDAYGSTFMMLARAAWESGDPELRAFLKAHKADVLRIGQSSLATQQPNGLTWSKPQHHIAYALDNMQVYRGMLDGAQFVEEAYGDGETAARWRVAAQLTGEAIETYLWDEPTQSYRWFVGQHFTGPSSDLSIAYPGALAQDMAILYRVPGMTSSRAAALLSRTYAAMSAPIANDGRDYRLIYDLAVAGGGAHVDPPPFSTSYVCVDGGWYLQLASVP